MTEGNYLQTFEFPFPFQMKLDYIFVEDVFLLIRLEDIHRYDSTKCKSLTEK